MIIRIPRTVTAVLLFGSLALLAGCSASSLEEKRGSTTEAERAKLSDEDRALVEAQEWCAVRPEDTLGEMGAPVKVMVKGQPVFVCCEGCIKKALANPDKTLAEVEKLKAKKHDTTQPR